MAADERRRPTRGDLLWAAALTAAAQIELAAVADSVQGPMVLQRLCFLLVTAPLALWRPAPLLAAALCGLGLGGVALVGAAPIASGLLATLLLLVRLGLGCAPSTSVGGLALVVLLSGVPRLATGISAADLVVNLVILVGAWAGAVAVRRSIDRRVAAELDRDHAAQAAVAAERARIARDLHDSVAHAVTVMTLTAGAARQHSQEPTVTAALRSVETTGRTALTDLNLFLGLLGSDVEGLGEAPGLADLADVVDRSRAAGAHVALQVEGDPSSVPASIGTTVYRIVQESLTNALKHSAVADVLVDVTMSDDAVTVHVTSPLGGPSGDPPPAGGRGLDGLGRRVALFGGTLAAGPDGDSWTVDARLPLAGSVA